MPEARRPRPVEPPSVGWASLKELHGLLGELLGELSAVGERRNWCPGRRSSCTVPWRGQASAPANLICIRRSDALESLWDSQVDAHVAIFTCQVARERLEALTQSRA